MSDPRHAWQLERRADGGQVWQVPDGWQQGRGAYGGLVTAALVAAMAEVSGDRPLRSLMATLCGPAMVGEAEVEVLGLREGSKLSALTATLKQGGVVAHGVGVTGEARADDRRWLTLSWPDPAPWQGGMLLPPGAAPVFTQNFEYEPLFGFPHTGDAPTSGGWVRLRGGQGPLDAALITALIDAWWPGAFVTLPAPRPMGTVATTIDLLPVPEGMDASQPVFLRVQLLAGAEGHLVEQRDLWTQSGQLLAVNHQTQALIR